MSDDQERETRRGHGEGGLYWSPQRQRWIAEITTGYDGRGTRLTRKASGRTVTAARKKLRDMLRDDEDGTTTAPGKYTVADAVQDWLTYGHAHRAQSTVDNYTTLSDNHIVPALGARALRPLTADVVDRWFADKARTLSTRTLRLLHSILVRAVDRAMARDRVKRNVVRLCTPPAGQPGRPSKSLTVEQAIAILRAAVASVLHAYIVLSLLTGARTEELRALRWRDLDLTGNPDTDPPVPASMLVIRSIRTTGDTKTRKSRRRLALPQRCVDALKVHQASARHSGPDDVVFATSAGTPYDAHNVRRAFRVVVKAAGLEPGAWTPRELRHSFVSILSDTGVPIEDIARLVGHSGTAVTETVYRKQIRPILEAGATVMDDVFPEDQDEDDPAP